MKRAILVFLLLIVAQLVAQDFHHMHLWVEPIPLNQSVKGKVVHTFTLKNERDSIFLNGIRMQYLQVLLNDKKADYRATDKGIFISTKNLNPNDTQQLSMAYTCKPRKGLYFVGWNQEYPNPHPQIWTQGQGIDHRHWIPHKDDQTDKITFDLQISFSQHFHVISNGELVSVNQVPHTTAKTWHYRSKIPMSSYLIAIAIGKYSVIEKTSASGIPQQLYYYPDKENLNALTYYKDDEIFSFMENEIGMPFPWPVYRQIPVQDFRHGAMENTSAVIFGDFYCTDTCAFNDQKYTYVNAHELAHHWFGNWITATESAHHWLHEGFATYYQWRSEQNLYGDDYFEWERKLARDRIFEAMKHDTLALSEEGAGAERYYQKGAWVLSMLNEQLGHEKLKKSLVHYLNKYAQGLVTTDSLNQAILETTGEDFSYFFQNWIHTKGNPVLNLKSRVDEDKITMAILEGSYLPFRSFDFDVTLHFWDAEPEKHTMHWNSMSKMPTTHFNILLPKSKRLKCWVINPQAKQLLFLKEEKPKVFAIYQFHHATHLLDKYAALECVSTQYNVDYQSFLEHIVLLDTLHFGLRAKALDILLKADYSEHEPLLIYALKAEDLNLQKEAVLLVQKPSKGVQKILHAIRLEPSYTLRESVIHKLINLEKPDANKWLYDSIYENEPGIPAHKVYITTLVYRAFVFKDEAALIELVHFASPAYDFMTRQKALEYLQAIKYSSKELVKLEFLALFNANWKLRKSAKEILKAQYEKPQSKKIIDDYMAANKRLWNEQQLKVVERTFGQ